MKMLKRQKLAKHASKESVRENYILNQPLNHDWLVIHRACHPFLFNEVVARNASGAFDTSFKRMSGHRRPNAPTKWSFGKARAVR